MKLDKLAVTLREIKKSFGLDMTDLLILDDVARAQKAIGKVTIMELVESCEAASEATVHARIKKLCDRKFLRKDSEQNNLRNKLLNFGPTYQKLVDVIGAL